MYNIILESNEKYNQEQRGIAEIIDYMRIDAKDRKREVALILLTAIVLAFLINFIAAIIFNSVYIKFPTLSLLLSTIFVVLTSLALYVIIVSKAKKSITAVSFPLTYSSKLGAFLDLPRCPISVNARVCFDRLPPEGRKHLACYDKVYEFWNSDFNRFIDHVIQKFLLTNVFCRLRFEKSNYDQVSFADLPNGIRENTLLRTHIETLNYEYKLLIPYFDDITTYGRNNCFLNIKTKYGRLRCEWTISYCNGGHYSEYFIRDSKLKSIDDYHDYYVTLTMTYECKFWKIFSKKLEKFLHWANEIETEFLDMNWKASEIDRLFVLLQEIKERKD